MLSACAPPGGRDGRRPPSAVAGDTDCCLYFVRLVAMLWLVVTVMVMMVRLLSQAGVRLTLVLLRHVPVLRFTVRPSKSVIDMLEVGRRMLTCSTEHRLSVVVTLDMVSELFSI